jgi:1-deoxy-D-xylulose-5-phosphate reductoisomerase
MYFCIFDDIIFNKIKKKFKNKKTKIINNLNDIKFKKKINISISAIPGISGLNPTLLFLKKSNKLLIANKESIICGWSLIENLAKKNKTQIIPIDSEHFSILKLIQSHKIDEIKKIYLTASGGPFLKFKKKKIKNIGPKEALKHPKWNMGKKISIDSATLMNKILELVEAHKLFKIPYNKLDILIHPDSFVHAIIQLNNGLYKFIYHENSMIIPIANAIFEKDFNIEHFYKSKLKRTFKRNLTFDTVDHNIFPTIKLKKLINKGPSTPIIINASNEVLVEQFLAKKIAFYDIFKYIMDVLKDKNYRNYAIRNPKNINQIYTINNWAKKTTLKKIK